MKWMNLVLAMALGMGVSALAQTEGTVPEVDGRTPSLADRENRGQKRKRLAHHQNRERSRLRKHQLQEREACRGDGAGERCQQLRRHQKNERRRLQAHEKRERHRFKARRKLGRAGSGGRV